MLRRRSWVMGLVVVGLAGSAACSDADEGGSAERDAYVEAFVDAAQASGEETDEDSDRCFAESAVDAIGVRPFREADVTPDEIRETGASSPTDLGVEVTDEQGEDYHQRLSRCLDLREYVLDLVTAGVELPDESVACLEQAFDDDLIRRVVVANFVQGREAESSEVADDLGAVYAGCAPAASG